MVVRLGLQTPPRMQGSWSDNDTKMSKAMVKSCRGVDDKPSPSINGSPQYYHRCLYINHILEPQESNKELYESLAKPSNEPTLMKWRSRNGARCVFVCVCSVFRSWPLEEDCILRYPINQQLNFFLPIVINSTFEIVTDEVFFKNVFEPSEMPSRKTLNFLLGIDK